MRCFHSLPALLLALSLTIALVSAIEVDSLPRSATRTSRVGGPRLPVTLGPCVRCVRQTFECQEGCAFSEVDPQSDVQCRAACENDQVQCLDRCGTELGVQMRSEAAAREVQQLKAAHTRKRRSGRSPRVDTFLERERPRPHEMDRGYGPETVKVRSRRVQRMAD